MFVEHHTYKLKHLICILLIHKLNVEITVKHTCNDKCHSYKYKYMYRIHNIQINIEMVLIFL
jgi:hypothetical protein